MKKYSVGGIIVSLLLVFSIFTLLYVSEVNAAEVISVNASGFENTIIIELENDLKEMRRENKRFALSTQCIGLGQGIATVLETVN